MKSLLEILNSDLLANNKDRIGFIGVIMGFFFDPGFCVAAKIRFMIFFYKKIPILSKFIWLALVRRGIYVSPRAVIGRGVFFPHPTGIVIGDGCVIGDNATIYQGVTIGRKDVEIDSYPVVGNNCIMCAGSVVIGNLSIGNNVIIGANSVVNKSIPCNSVVAGVPARFICVAKNK